MNKSKRIYWKGLEELTNDPEFVKHADKEFVQPGADEDPRHSRRDFLAMMGFGVAAVSVAACEAPVRNAIPFVDKPVDLDASNPYYYASTYTNGGDYCSILVKTREGRPIKVDGNQLSGVTRGGTSAQVEASVLSLYDNDRLRKPKVNGTEAAWEDVDKEIISRLQELRVRGGQIRVVSHTLLSPSTKAVLATFLAKYPTAKHVMYDTVSGYGMLKGNETSFGSAFIPSYDFSKAEVIVGIGADFLNTWLAPIEFSKQYAATRQVNAEKREMSRHYQFESLLTVTGANADYRTSMKPSEESGVVLQLYNLVAAHAGKSPVAGGVDKPMLQKAADELWEHQGRALVVCGSNDPSVQVVVNAINSMLGSYGTTILTHLPVNYRQGDDAAMMQFVNEVKAGQIGGAIFFNCNPVYDHPLGAELAAGLKSVHLTVSTSYKEDETGAAVGYLAPDHHYLEAWNDAEPRKNHYSLAQPAITPVFATRAAQESFITWAEETPIDYFQFVKDNWRNMFVRGGSGNYDTVWDKWVYNGIYELPVEVTPPPPFVADVDAAVANIIAAAEAPKGPFELMLYVNGTVGDGSQANNPLLQELPDPITKTVWEHCITVAQKDATQLGLQMKEGFTRLGKVTVGDKSFTLPLIVQPGQAPGTLGIPVGYGRTHAGKVADGIGVNVYPLVGVGGGALKYAAGGASFEVVDESYHVATTQTHQTYMGRETIIQETRLSEFKKDPGAGRWHPHVTTWKGPERKVEPGSLSMWKGHDYFDHHWGMAIDLNACTGCGACVVACNVENNIALVGRDQVIRRHEMHWLRIDRYYSSDADVGDWKGLEQAADNPEVVFQPMLCQHCNNAPCETVCPVAATTHSTDGLNMMAYNRCIGTRYCANNCPYKVRRFNWFKYHDNDQFAQSNPQMNTDLGKMVLNPEVTVRSRGVMEKCSFCAQRIQAGKLSAKRERRKVQDGEVKTACQVACATGAIVFGDMNDPESKLTKLLDLKPADPERPYGIDKVPGNPRAYRVLEDIGVKPNIFYLTKVRNKDESV